MNQKILNNKGQALLLVVVAMTIALTVGVAVTSRTVSSLKRTSSTDTSARVYAAAEGGVEWFLRQPVSVLDKLADGDNNGGADCPAGSSGAEGNNAACQIEYQPQDNDKIQSKAVVSISKFSVNDSENSAYWFNLNPGDVKEIALKDFQSGVYYRGNMDICWKSQETANTSGIYYLTYNSTGIKDKKIISPEIVYGTYVVNGQVTASSGRLGYDNCYNINISTDLNGIRFKSLYAPSKVAVIPASGNFPTQGYKISSLGQIDNVAEKVKAVKEITVYRSLPYAPSAFDYALYSTAPID